MVVERIRGLLEELERCLREVCDYGIGDYYAYSEGYTPDSIQALCKIKCYEVFIEKLKEVIG